MKHPTAYASRVSAGVSPGYARECLDASTQRVERVLLQLRLVEGLDLMELDDAGRSAAVAEVAAGLLDPVAFERGRGVLTREGRLLADGSRAAVARLVDLWCSGDVLRLGHGGCRVGLRRQSAGVPAGNDERDHVNDGHPV